MPKGETKRIAVIIEAAVRILDAERPMTLRQLFYRLVSTGIIENDRNHYQMMSRVMTKARDDGRCDFDAIVDRSRPEYCREAFADPAAYLKAVARSYHKDYWRSQPYYCEVWVEKDAIVGCIEETTDELGVKVRVGRGFQSTTRAHEIAEYFDSLDDLKQIQIYYLGDHDPSGRMIEDDLRRRIENYTFKNFTLRRLAIFREDIEVFNLPPLRVKPSDSRARGFVAEHGRECVELDALPPEELRSRVRRAIGNLIDRRQWDRAVKVETAELASIRDILNRWPGMNANQG
jgi:hypothetical protein